MSQRKQRTDAVIHPENWAKQLKHPSTEKAVTRERKGAVKRVQVNKSTWVEVPEEADEQTTIENYYRRYQK